GQMVQPDVEVGGRRGGGGGHPVNIDETGGAAPPATLRPTPASLSYHVAHPDPAHGPLSGGQRRLRPRRGTAGGRGSAGKALPALRKPALPPAPPHLPDGGRRGGCAPG